MQNRKARIWKVYVLHCSKFFTLVTCLVRLPSSVAAHYFFNINFKFRLALHGMCPTVRILLPLGWYLQSENEILIQSSGTWIK